MREREIEQSCSNSSVEIKEEVVILSHQRFRDCQLSARGRNKSETKCQHPKNKFIQLQQLQATGNRIR